jgi:hypothetical protein
MYNKTARHLLHRVCILLMLAACLAACTMLTAGDQQWLAIPDRPGNRITATMIDGATVLDIYSEGGIGGAFVQWVAGDYLARIVLRLHLRGLEDLRLAYATTAITVSIPSTGGFAVRQAYATAGAAPGQSHAITPDSPYWMKTAIVGQTERAQNPIPLTSGWIEVELPPHFLQGRYTGFTIQWIDFYR